MNGDDEDVYADRIDPAGCAAVLIACLIFWTAIALMWLRWR